MLIWFRILNTNLKSQNVMKKLIIKKSLMLFTIFIIVTACEKDIILFDSSMNLVGFTSSSVVIKEDNSGVATLYLGAPENTPATTITLSVDTAGLGASAAREGVDFNLSASSVVVGVGETTVDIEPVNNDIFTGDKKFYLVITSNSLNYLISSQKRLLVTISDDEHPLKAWIGTYDVEAPSFTVPGDWDEAWVVTTSPIEGHNDQLLLEGVGLSGTGLVATLDPDAMTITIAPGQNIGLAYADWGYDVVGQDEITVYFGHPDLTWESDVDLVGTLEANGNMEIDGWCSVQDGAVWDVFNTTWIKR